MGILFLLSDILTSVPPSQASGLAVWLYPPLLGVADLARLRMLAVCIKQQVAKIVYTKR